MKKPLVIAILFIAVSCLPAACSPGSQPLNSTPTETPLPVSTAVPTTASRASNVEVLYYDISGFLVRVGDKKILIDTLFDSYPGHSPPQEAFEMMLKGEPPFDQVDVVLTTHAHPDHFSAAVMSEFLLNNPETVLVSTFQVVEELVEESPDLLNSIYSVDIQRGESEVISLDGIEIECLYISHGDPNLLNLGFIVRVDQVTFFHSGDIVLEDVSVDELVAYGLPELDLDFALVVFHVLKYEQYHQHLTEGIQAKYVIPTHYQYDNPLNPYEAFPDAVLFSDTMQTWQMP
ncbi:MAG: MBL fold metallo-hydrolase [Chloroflexota bacterium]